MSKNLDVAKAREIIRRRQNNPHPQDDETAHAPTRTTTGGHNNNAAAADRRQQQHEHRPPVRITVSSDGTGTPHAAADRGTTPQIYSVPTTDTLGDESLMMVMRPFLAISTPVRQNSNHHQRRTDENSNAAALLHHRRHASQPTIGSSVAIASVPSSHSLSSSREPRNDSEGPWRNFRTTKRERTATTSKKKEEENEFQIPGDCASVRVQMVDTAKRSAFECRPPLALDVWQRIAEQGGAARRTGNVGKRLSPSFQHLTLLHQMQSMNMIRQVQFSPSTSLEADVFVDWWESSHDVAPNNKHRNRRDGRYRSIDPVRATVDVLPQTPPVLSNKKLRLPRRSDVGFPNATSDEVRVKQWEILKETEWEGASPRLVVLVTSDDLGKAVKDVDGGEGSSHLEGISSQHLELNGGGLEGIPFAGRDLIQAKERNARYFGQPGVPACLVKFLAPDPCSMLAPPLGAIYSPSQGWRPRPFHDRPAGMRYCLICPVQVRFDVGDLEPLVCSMALYTLPDNSTGPTKGPAKAAEVAFGKISEEFWFPAGDWHGKVNLGDARGEDGTIDESLTASWMNQKTKGIFSFDPIALAGGTRSVFVVVQVYRLAGPSGLAPYSHGPKSDTHDEDCEATRRRASRVFHLFGTHLQTPLCFGCTQLFPSNPNSRVDETLKKWPGGELLPMSLHGCPLIPESQDAFVARLASLAHQEKRDILVGDSKSNVSGSFVSLTSEGPRRKRGVGRLFRVNSKQSSQSTALDAELGSDAGYLDYGDCTVFVSSLSSDFLQAMLANPVELHPNPDFQTDTRLPRLMADVSGDLAVLLDPSIQTTSLNDIPALKRSSLLRLPFAGEPAGYVRGSEFREILYLPARVEKHYDIDAGLSHRSLLNLLYLYPKLLRRTSNVPTSLEQSQFTIRIQTIQSQSTTDGESGRISPSNVTLNAFHNQAAWSGTCLLDQFYTKTFGSAGVKIPAGADPLLEYSMRDEVKIQLPPVMDGSYSVRFELYCISTVDTELSLQFVADASIPLSSSISRETGRVTTIIPNGNHRLKLGGFQLQLETRLVSSIHVCDPSVAAFLRDYPCVHDNRIAETTPPLGSGSNGSQQLVEAAERIDSLILHDASPGAVVSHFEILLHIHLRNMVKRENCEESFDQVTAKFLRGNMISLLMVCRKLKEKFLTLCNGNRSELLRVFMKRWIDVLDEQQLPSSLSPCPTTSGTLNSESETQDDLRIEPSLTNEDAMAEESHEIKHEGAVRIKSSAERSAYRNLRRTTSPTSPFSRIAYGASKTDRMRIEAELRVRKSFFFSNYFDDDETIVTTHTLQTLKKDLQDIPREENKWPHIPRSNTSGDGSSDNSIVRASSTSSKGNLKSGHRPSGSAEFAQRVKTVAQVMLAPCVGPSLSNILAKSASPQSSSKGDPKTSSALKDRILPDTHSLPDSDAEGEECATMEISGSGTGTGRSERSDSRGPVFYFSIQSRRGDQISVTRASFLYESIILLWLNEWVDHVEASLKDPGRPLGDTGTQFATFPLSDQREQTTSSVNSPIFSYYAHMDVLLPVCLKSIVLRYNAEVLHPVYPPSTKALLDERHLAVMEPFVEMLARGLLGQALAGLGSSETREEALLRSLSSCNVVLDFLVGMLSVIHAEHMHTLLRKFLKTLRHGETEHLLETDSNFEWSEESLHRVRCSRQLRILAVERLAVLPHFLCLNYPPKYTAQNYLPRQQGASWTVQFVEKELQSSGSMFGSTQPEKPLLLPPCRWLADMILSEALSICSLSSEVVVAEAIAHIEVTANHSSKNKSLLAPSLKKRPGAALKRKDLLMFQSIAMHAITCVYELLLRRHAMDKRFQTDHCRERIAGLFAGPILEKSLSASRWLARMESTHKVRSIWLLCFVYILQEAPASMLRNHVRSLCNPANVQIHRFIRLLRLSSSTFQSFVDLPKHANFPSEIDKGLSPWLLQESFNTVAAATIIVVDECTQILRSNPVEQEKMMSGVLDLLLFLLTTPQSSVTHLRAVGGALQALEDFGAQSFLDVTGSSLQHWIRVILSLMNSTSLSARSIAVDFVVSLLGSTFDLIGDVDFMLIIFVTVLPEVAAREIALHSVSGLITSADDLARSLWPLRRSFADLEDSNPVDDERIDPHLSNVLSVFCRACQAAMDGVLVELFLRGDGASIVGSNIRRPSDAELAFDADEESLFEAATFFDAVSAPMQRVRWLVTLSRLHEYKRQWLEAAEALFLCATTITESMPHLKNVWRPSNFVLWSDSRRSLWLDTVGEEIGRPDRGNTQVMEFAEQFLEPIELCGTEWKPLATGKLRQPNVSNLSILLDHVVGAALKLYQLEGNMDDLAHSRLELLMKATMGLLERHSTVVPAGTTARKRHVDDETCLRQVLASVSGNLTKVAERMRQMVQSDPGGTSCPSTMSPPLQFLVLRLAGKKPPRFQECTSLPPFLEFDTPCICRIPSNLVSVKSSHDAVSAKELPLQYAKSLVSALEKDCGSKFVRLVTDASLDNQIVDDNDVTYIYAYPLDSTPTFLDVRHQTSLLTRSFFYRKMGSNGSSEKAVFIELKVAHTFPCALSRQRTVLTTEIGLPGM